MREYKIRIEAYYAENGYLEISEKEMLLFYINNKAVKLLSLDNKIIAESKGIMVECGTFTDLNECIRIAKKIYCNFLLALNDTSISYVLDKFGKGNFRKYCKDEDIGLYKEIIINDMNSKDKNFYISVEKGPIGCTHFQLNDLEDIGLNYKLKNSLFINNYRKYLKNDKRDTCIDDTLYSASMEVLLDNQKRPKCEIDVINEVAEYLDGRAKETGNVNYNIIKEMVLNNKHKSIRSQKEELIRKYFHNNVEENIKIIDKISKNRTKEVHLGNAEEKETLYDYTMLNKLQWQYAIDLYKKDEQK